MHIPLSLSFLLPLLFSLQLPCACMSCVHNTLSCTVSLSLSKTDLTTLVFFFFPFLGFLYLKKYIYYVIYCPENPKKNMFWDTVILWFLWQIQREWDWYILFSFIFFSFFFQWIVFNYIHFIIKKAAVPLIPRPWRDGLTRRFINWGSNFGLKKI